MITGAVAAAVAVALAILTTRATSRIQLAVARITRARIGHDVRVDAELAPRATGAIAGALVGCVIGLALGLGILPVPVSAFV